MARKPKTNRVERTRAGGEWTEAGWIGFLRSGLRQMSRRWPPLARQAINAARRKYTGENKRQKWEYQCATCKGWRNRKQVEVDHIVPCGSLRSLDDLPGFVERLFCEPDGLRVLCDTCHALRTAAAKLREKDSENGRVQQWINDGLTKKGKERLGIVDAVPLVKEVQRGLF